MSERSSSLRYGWAIVAAMLLVQTVSSGLGFYNMSVYISEFSKALDVPVASTSFAVSLFFIAGGISGMWIADLLNRIHVRYIMVTGACLGGLALGLLTYVEELWQVYALFALFGFGNAGVSLVVATTLITQWFTGSNRSIALSTASTGLSLGGVLLTPLSAYWINDWGLFATMPVLGLMFTVCILPLAIWVVRPAPAAAAAPAIAESADWSYVAAIRTRFYIWLALGYVLCMGAQVGGIAHLYSRVDEIAGFADAARAVQILTICSIVGRLVGGFIVAHVAIRWFTLGNLVVQMIGLTALATAESALAAWLGAGLFGASVGNLLMLQPLWLAQAFPGTVYARVFALANALSVIGVAFGPYLMGLAYDLYDYHTAFFSAGLVSLVAWFFIWRAGPGPVRSSLAATG